MPEADPHPPLTGTVLRFERRRAQRRDAAAAPGYPPEVLALLRACGADVRAGDVGSPAAACDRRST